jgi:DNA-binding PadR family transcriptional regulator
MQAGRAKKAEVARDATPMHSAVNWALLGLVIERPSYAYELAQRFDRIYQDALSLSSVSHVYTALGTLKSRALIENVPGTGTERQPKPHYRATHRGVREHREWLVAQICEDRRRQRLLVVQLAALTHHPQGAMEVIARCEQAWLEEAGNLPLADREGGAPDPGSELVAHLVEEERRLTVDAKLAWLEYARRELKVFASVQGSSSAQATRR